MGRTDPVTYAGWVFKEGSLVRSWKKRFLVCKGAELAYYKNTDEENHAQLLGALTAAHIERLPDITNGLLIHGTEDDAPPPPYPGVGIADNNEPFKENDDAPEMPGMFPASSFRRHIVVETAADNTASFVEVAERESEDNGEKPYSPTAPGTTTIRRMRLAEKLLQEELEEERKEAMLKENTVLMRPSSKSDAPDVKGCCCVVM
ncbi:hypothetical protein BBO99_00004899 [Phytophthora kernoviae]|uniref:Uncharacterized protein n=2 Tax=Phytophthora kernoviae TaxID=325452 RepID=A0A3R7KJM3_9STRA|nr:hypothetical protein G195_007362 [Phytophthora kernoviae 00238/432]KAG2524402.1 hypothetical protein JM16_004998 [Phytophthora kernoviae]KAG2526112.1 hypothetical protein JM18_004237 [Phytophthora kernoviae]RLN02815.1 hypothetical protein BBI17_005001 [Phytophthora kernoviae]RLN79933.1 hypothetical protein BBO99_00004899 [Phytophthora kernoviae]